MLCRLAKAYLEWHVVGHRAPAQKDPWQRRLWNLRRTASIHLTSSTATQPFQFCWCMMQKGLPGKIWPAHESTAEFAAAPEFATSARL